MKRKISQFSLVILYKLYKFGLKMLTRPESVRPYDGGRSTDRPGFHAEILSWKRPVRSRYSAVGAASKMLLCGRGSSTCRHCQATRSALNDSCLRPSETCVPENLANNNPFIVLPVSLDSMLRKWYFWGWGWGRSEVHVRISLLGSLALTTIEDAGPERQLADRRVPPGWSDTEERLKTTRQCRPVGGGGLAASGRRIPTDSLSAAGF
jgi:hypothetical protein